VNAVYARLWRAKAADDLGVDGQIELATQWLVARGEPGTVEVFVDNGPLRRERDEFGQIGPGL
jgi:hypothetical protein